MHHQQVVLNQRGVELVVIHHGCSCMKSAFRAVGRSRDRHRLNAQVAQRADDRRGASPRAKHKRPLVDVLQKGLNGAPEPPGVGVVSHPPFRRAHQRVDCSDLCGFGPQAPEVRHHSDLVRNCDVQSHHIRVGLVPGRKIRDVRQIEHLVGEIMPAQPLEALCEQPGALRGGPQDGLSAQVFCCRSTFRTTVCSPRPKR